MSPSVLTTRAAGTDIFELGIGNSLDLLTYQLYQATAVSPTASWNLLATGGRGQTNLLLTNTLPQEFFRVGVLTNY